MLDALRRFFADRTVLATGVPAVPATDGIDPRAADPRADGGSAVTVRMDAVFPGQAQDAELLSNRWVIDLGSRAVGAAPELTGDTRNHIEAFARAEGAGKSALPYDPDTLPGDARDEELRAELDSEWRDSRQALADARRELAESERALRAAPTDATAGIVVGGVFALAVGIAGGLILHPTVLLVLGDSFVELAGPDHAFLVSTWASLLIGLVPPMLAMGGAWFRASALAIGFTGVIEVAAMALLAWGRMQLLSAVPSGIDVTDAERALLESDGVARSTMLLALEALFAAGVTALGIELSRRLVKADVRPGLIAEVEAGRQRVAETTTRLAELNAARREDARRLSERDVAAERGQKVEDLTRVLMMQGALEQAEANLAVLEGSPRARVDRDVVTLPIDDAGRAGAN
jgi:hypothetical protein